MTSRHGDTLPIADISILWITAGLGCDGDTIAMTAATQPSIEDLVSGAPSLDPEGQASTILSSPTKTGDDFMPLLPPGRRGRARSLHPGGRGLHSRRDQQGRRLLGRVRHRSPRPASPSPPANGSTGSRPRRGPWSRPAPAPPTAASTPWRAIRPAAWACPTISAGNGNRRAGIPHRLRPGLSRAAGQHHGDAALPAPQAAGRAPMIPLDEALRRPGCSGRRSTKDAIAAATTNRASSPRNTARRSCIVKLGCWGPVVQCNVGKRGWMGGIGGCPNVGGICIGCTMPGFPDKFMPFMNQPPGSLLSSAAVMTYGRAIHALRRFTQASLNKEPAGVAARGRTGGTSSEPTRRETERIAAEAIAPADLASASSSRCAPRCRHRRPSRPLPQPRGASTAPCVGADAGRGLHGVSRSGIGEAYVSPQIEAALGFSQAEWLEDPVRWYQQIHPDDKRPLEHRGRGDVSHRQAAALLVSGAGARRRTWSGSSARPRWCGGDDGRPWFIHGVGFDITDLKTAEAALQEERNLLSGRPRHRGCAGGGARPRRPIVRFNRACELHERVLVPRSPRPLLLGIVPHAGGERAVPRVARRAPRRAGAAASTRADWLTRRRLPPPDRLVEHGAARLAT